MAAMLDDNLCPPDHFVIQYTGCRKRKSRQEFDLMQAEITAFTRSVLIFSESSYFNLKFGIK